MASVYLAARYTAKELIRPCADTLRYMGHEVTSGWLFGAESDDLQAIAARDEKDILRSDALIQFTGYGTDSTGHNTEFGIARGAGLTCIIIGPPEDIFWHLPGVLHYPTWEDFLASLPRSE